MPKELLLFIHGLGGNPLDTWRGFPELVQADEALRSRFEVGFFHYPTSLFRGVQFR